MTDPKPEMAQEDLLTNERDNESSIGDLDIDTSDADDLNQSVEPDDKPGNETDDLDLVRDDGKGEEDLGFTR